MFGLRRWSLWRRRRLLCRQRRALVSRDPEKRRRAAELLGTHRDSRAADLLIAGLGDESYRVRRECATALGNLEFAAGVPALIDALTDTHWAVREAAATALAQSGCESASDSLVKALRDGHSEVRASAAKALGAIRNASATQSLITALADPDPSSRVAAAQALADIGEHKWKDAVLGTDEDWLRLSATGDRRACRPLARVLERSDPAAVEPLRRIGAPEPLIVALDDPVVRYDAIRALGDIGDPAGVDALLRLLTQHDLIPIVAEALGKIGDPRAIEPLSRILRILTDAEGQAARTVVRALGRLGIAAVDALIRSLQHPSVAAIAAYQLGELGDKRAIGPLAKMLYEPESCAAAADALARISSPEANEALAEGLMALGGVNRLTAARALARTGDPRGHVAGDIEEVHRLRAVVDDFSKNAQWVHRYGSLPPFTLKWFRTLRTKSQCILVQLLVLRSDKDSKSLAQHLAATQLRTNASQFVARLDPVVQAEIALSDAPGCPQDAGKKE